MNLIAKASVNDIIENHFLDSLALLPLLSQAGVQNLLDVGSGAGFPGLVLKCARPDLHVTLIEPREKRAGFLRHIARGLSLQNVNILSCRLPVGEDSHHPLAGKTFSLVTSRALTDTMQFLAMVEGITEEEGRVVCMKGPKAEAELSAWHSDKMEQALLFTEKISYTLPFSGVTRYLLVFSKRRTKKALSP
jgi:16S rRNA (guanine527-N7)-methyltransferase